MRLKGPELFEESRERRLSDRILLDLSGPPFGRQSITPELALSYARKHRVEIIIATLSLLLVWQWHVARLATQRAEIAEKDMQLNARQALQLSKAVLQAQASHDRLERRISGDALPEPN